MTLLAVRSIPLSKETRDAWRAAGVDFAKRTVSLASQLNQFSKGAEARGIINLGNLDSSLNDYNGRVFNLPATIRSISHPVALRRTLNDFIPERNMSVPHWHKSGGFGGVGAVFHEKILAGCPLMKGDVQAHVEGTEFRVISVGHTVVQAFRKDNVVWTGGKHDFDWTWVGVVGISSNGIIPFIKSGLDNIEGSATSVLGWDILVGDRPYAIEINTSPGVNAPTAERIVKQINTIIG